MSDNSGSASSGGALKQEIDDGSGGVLNNNDEISNQSQPQHFLGAAQRASPNPYTNGGGGGSSASSNASSGRSDICRDFLNNVCFRGARCRFYHPPEIANNPERNKEVIKDFCHDYQNKGCTRESCRYVHCTREDMEEYMRSGKINESLARALVAVTGQEVIDGRPICKEFLSGRCSRGQRCRFWHINPAEERERRQMERAAGARAVGAMGYRPPTAPPTGAGVGIGAYGSMTGYGAYDYRAAAVASGQPEYKRPRLDDERSPVYGAVTTGMAAATAVPPGRPSSPAAYMALQEENIALRRKIDVLKQTIAELSASNDNMIAENNRLRAKLQVQVPSVGGPPSMNDPSSIVGSMAATATAALSNVLTSASQGLAGATQQSAAITGQISADHLAAVSLAAVAQQTMAAAQQSMAMSATSDAATHWTAAMRR